VTAAEDRIRNAKYRYGQDVQDEHGNTVTVNGDVLYTRAGTEVVAVKPTFDPNVGTDEEPPDAEPPDGDHAAGDETPVTPVVVTCPPQDPIAVAQQFVDEVMTHSADQALIVRWWRGDHYTWVGNCWLEQSTPKLRAALYRALQNAWYPVEVLGVQILARWRPTRRKVGDLLEALQALIHLDERVDPPQWIVGGDRGAVISVGNGNMSVTGRTITEHTPRLFNLSCLPFDYEPDTPAPQVWLGFLKELFGDDLDSIMLLQEWFGYVLSGATSQHKIMLLVGPPRAGKGTIARTLTALVGRDGVAAPTLAALGTNFGLSPLIGKTLAVVGDVRLGPDALTVTERLLTISGEDTLTIDRKYRDPWTGRLGVRFMLLSNELPKLGDASGAMASRFVVLQLAQSWLGKEDLDLEDKLSEEMTGILNWALDGLDRLRAQGRFTAPQSSTEAITALEDLSSPIRQFIRERCELGSGYDVTVDHLYDAWKAWCGEQGRIHVSTKQVFGRDLRAALPGVQGTQPRDGDRRVPCHQGIQIRAVTPSSECK
jgi:putative DNA primase/helicase